jgi:dihydrofolate reductase
MHVFIIVAQTTDGFIARLPAEGAGAKNQISTIWTSKEDSAFFKERTKQAGVVVMGARTFETIGKPLPGRLTIVYSEKDLPYEGIEVTKKSPKELLAELEARGYKEVAICGGASIYTLFMEAGVVDTMYITTEPVTFGLGVPLFTKPITVHKTLIATRSLAENVVLNEYKVSR